MAHTQGKKPLIGTASVETQTLDLLDKGPQSVISDTAKELIQATAKEPKETMRMLFYQIKNTNKDISVFKSNQIEILEWKSIITEMQTSLEGIRSRFELAKE